MLEQFGLLLVLLVSFLSSSISFKLRFSTSRVLILFALALENSITQDRSTFISLLMKALKEGYKDLMYDRDQGRPGIICIYIALIGQCLIIQFEYSKNTSSCNWDV